MSLGRSSSLMSWAYCAKGPASASGSISTKISSTTAAACSRCHQTPGSLAMQTRNFSTSQRRCARIAGHHARDHYKVLKLHQTASKQQIKARFYELSKQLHPDTPGGSSEKFHEISEAYGVLGDERRRKDYDLSLDSPSPAQTPNFGTSSSYPYSDPLTRRNAGPHSAWSTRRPPPTKQSPTPGNLHYTAFGRHTPPNFRGGTGYGESYMASREQLREDFAGIRKGRPSASGGDGSTVGGGGSSGIGGGAGQAGHSRREEGEGGTGGQIIMVFSLVVLVAFVMRVPRSRADEGTYEQESAAEGLGDGWGEEQS